MQVSMTQGPKMSDLYHHQRQTWGHSSRVHCLMLSMGVSRAEIRFIKGYCRKTRNRIEVRNEGKAREIPKTWEGFPREGKAIGFL